MTTKATRTSEKNKKFVLGNTGSTRALYTLVHFFAVLCKQEGFYEEREHVMINFPFSI